MNTNENHLTPDNSCVICPACNHQFRAIPVSVQALLISAGMEPPFTEAAPVQRTSDDAVAGALFDFMGFLTTRDEAVTFSASHLATPAVTLLEEWAAKRGLSLNEADVLGWKDSIAQRHDAATAGDAQPTVVAGDAVTLDCETCQGKGTIDETLGGEWFSNPRATCPDCDGRGESSPHPPAVATTIRKMMRCPPVPPVHSYAGEGNPLFDFSALSQYAHAAVELNAQRGEANALAEAEPARYVALKASGSRYAYVNDTQEGRTVQRYDIFENDGWTKAEAHTARLNALASTAKGKA